MSRSIEDCIMDFYKQTNWFPNFDEAVSNTKKFVKQYSSLIERGALNELVETRMDLMDEAVLRVILNYFAWNKPHVYKDYLQSISVINYQYNFIDAILPSYFQNLTLENVKTIREENAFIRSNVKSIMLPNLERVITAWAFDNAPSLEKVGVPQDAYGTGIVNAEVRVPKGVELVYI